MTQKTFSVAGVSTFKGTTKVRFANDFVSRIKILDKNEHTDVELIELGGEFTKAEIAQVLIAHPKFQTETSQSAIAEYVVRNVKSIKQEKAVVAPKTVVTPQVPAIKGMTPMGFNLSECEDAPF